MSTIASFKMVTVWALLLAGCFGPGEYIDLNVPNTEEDASVDGGVWGDFITIRINTAETGADIQSSVSGFPVLLRLTASALDFATIDPAGAGILFTDETDKILPHEIEQWDADNERATIWIRVPNLQANSEDQTFRMYLSVPDAPASDAPVFDKETEFGSVLHLIEVGNNLVDGYRDAGENNRNGTGVSMNSASRITGVAGFGQHFDGSSYISVPSLMNEPERITLSAWFLPDAAAGELISVGDSVLIRLDEQTGDLMGMVFNGTDWQVSRRTLPADADWHHVAFVVDTVAGRQSLYLDGELAAGSSSPNKIDYAIGYPDVSIAVHAGKDRLFYAGSIDEVRIITDARSADWIKLCYENQRLEGQSLVEILP